MPDARLRMTCACTDALRGPFHASGFRLAERRNAGSDLVRHRRQRMRRSRESSPTPRARLRRGREASSRRPGSRCCCRRRRRAGRRPVRPRRRRQAGQGPFPARAACPACCPPAPTASPTRRTTRVSRALAFALGSYRSAATARPRPSGAQLELPEGVDGDELSRIAEGVALARDLINTPANDMGPAELEAGRARRLRHGTARAFAVDRRRRRCSSRTFR